MCIHPNKRAATSHEYETDAWISIFNVTLTLPRVIKVYGYASSWATLSQLINTISIVVAEILSEKSLGRVGVARACGTSSCESPPRTLSSHSSDFPLRCERYNILVLAWISARLVVLAVVVQICSALWVRNGFPIRSQLLHHRDFMLRELCYDQDLFILQISLIILDPNTVIVTISSNSSVAP